MIDRGRIEQQLNAIGEGNRWWDVRELRDLPAVLREDEQILSIARGRLARLRRSWLVVLTDQRVLCLRSFAGAGWRHIEIDLQHIERVALRTGPLNGRVLIATAAARHRILMARPDAFRLHANLSSSVATRAQLGYVGGHLVRRMFDHVLALPAVAFGTPELPTALPRPRERDDELDQRVNTLEEQVQQLQQQVEFLEELLRERQLAANATGRAL
jgi:hypothetical protein